MYGSVSNKFDFKFFENSDALSACNILQALIFGGKNEYYRVVKK